MLSQGQASMPLGCGPPVWSGQQSPRGTKSPPDGTSSYFKWRINELENKKGRRGPIMCPLIALGRGFLPQTCMCPAVITASVAFCLDGLTYHCNLFNRCFQQPQPSYTTFQIVNYLLKKF